MSQNGDRKIGIETSWQISTYIAVYGVSNNALFNLVNYYSY